MHAVGAACVAAIVVGLVVFVSSRGTYGVATVTQVLGPEPSRTTGGAGFGSRRVVTDETQALTAALSGEASVRQAVIRARLTPRLGAQATREGNVVADGPGGKVTMAVMPQSSVPVVRIVAVSRSPGAAKRLAASVGEGLPTPGRPDTLSTERAESTPVAVSAERDPPALIKALLAGVVAFIAAAVAARRRSKA